MWETVFRLKFMFRKYCGIMNDIIFIEFLIDIIY
jgi:hypothetical protein